jgi:hypothetical protein
MNARRRAWKGVPTMWVAIAIVLVILWLLGAFAFKVTGVLIHLLLILAVIAVIVHFARRTTP